ncbi:MAG: hypothetical protein IJD04_00015 [Desulfovibrionaceae bacterium]|nr:hypothetical protein [Desulfovibrionaceae bacterium]
MLKLLDQIDQNLASFRLAIITDDKALVDSAVANIKGLLAQVSGHADAAKYADAAAMFDKEFPCALDGFVAAFGSDKAQKALDALTGIMGQYRPVVEGQPTDRNHI